MTTRRKLAPISLALLLMLATGCAGVPPHLELPTLDIKQPAFAATLGAYTKADRGRRRPRRDSPER